MEVGDSAFAPTPASAAVPAAASARAPASGATHTTAPVPSVAASQVAYANQMQRLNANGNRTGRQMPHAKTASAVTATATGMVVNASPAPPSHTTAPAPSVAASQVAYANHIRKLNAMGNRAGRQASHARNAAATTAMAVNASPAPILPSAPATAPIPATLGARAVGGGKSQQSDSIGPTSNRSRRRVGP